MSDIGTTNLQEIADFLEAEGITQTIVRWIEGDPTDTDTPDLAVWVEDASERDNRTGSDNIRSGRLLLPSSETALTTDFWSINDEAYGVRSIGQENFGVKVVTLEQRGEIDRRPAE